MQANQLTIKSYPGVGQINLPLLTGSSHRSLSGRINGWVNRIIGCWHTEMSRPFSSQGQAYRVCLNCGAHRRFNLRNWEMQGDFYYSVPTSKQFRAFSGLASVRRATG